MFLRKVLALLQRVLTNIVSSLLVLLVALGFTIDPSKDPSVILLFGYIKDLGLSISDGLVPVVFYGALSLLLILFIITMETATKNSVKNPEKNNEEYKKGGIIANAIFMVIYLAAVLIPYLIAKDKLNAVVGASLPLGNALDKYFIVVFVVFGVIIILDVVLCILKKAKKEKSIKRR